ncbi:SH3 domain-containing protein [bacterium CPR1]|nr:SH3 domain-containing protein [bacterium CPR1]
MIRLLVLLLLLWIAPALAQDGPVDDLATTFVAVIQDKDGYTNVRASADGKSAVVDKLHTGERFFVRQFIEEEWARVCTPRGIWGYAHRSRLKKVRSRAYYPVVVTDRDGYLNMRQGPGTDYPVVVQLARGECVVVLEAPGAGQRDVREVLAEKRWLQVIDARGKVGYVFSDRVRPNLE